jgi:hypothetical protein
VRSSGWDPVWSAKYQLPDGRQVQKTIGSAFTGRGVLRQGRSRRGRIARDLGEMRLGDVTTEVLERRPIAALPAQPSLAAGSHGVALERRGREELHVVGIDADSLLGWAPGECVADPGAGCVVLEHDE